MAVSIEMIEVACLGATIVAPPLATILAVWTVTKIISKKSVTIKGLFSLNPEKGAMEQTLLWICLCTPIAYFLTTGAFAWHPYSLAMSADGFNKFIEISKLPLGLLSLSIPLTILALRLHSTQQTALQIAKTTRQIEITEKKNNIDAFYAHRKALIEYYEKIGPTTYEGKINGKFAAHPRLHIKFFKNTPPDNGIPLVNTRQFKRTIRKLRNTRRFLAIALNNLEFHRDIQANQTTRYAHRSYQDETRKIRARAYIQACKLIFELSDTLILPEIYDTLKNKDQNEPKTIKYLLNKSQEITFHPIQSTAEILGAYRYLRSFTRLLCEFSGYSVTYFTTDTQYGHIDGKWDSEGIIASHTVRNLLNDISRLDRPPITEAVQ